MHTTVNPKVLAYKKAEAQRQREALHAIFLAERKAREAARAAERAQRSHHVFRYNAAVLATLA